MNLTLDRRTLLAGFGAASLPMPALAATPRGDPEWVKALLTTLHPGLHRYQSPRQFELRFATFARDWNRSVEIEPRYLALARLLGAIRCGHSHVNPHNQSDAIVARLTGGRRLLPFRFRWIGDRMVISEDFSGSGIPLGTIVAAVDRVPTPRILASLMPYARADGGNDAKRRALMEVTGEGEFEEFDLFHPLLFPIGETVRLDLITPAGGRRTHQLATIDRAARLAGRKSKATRTSDEPVWTMERRGAVAILTMPSWALYDSKWDWRTWLDQRFANIATDGTRGLIIDLRANEGGKEDIGNAILARLARAPIPNEPIRRLARFREVPPDLRGPLDTWDKSFVTLGKNAKPFNARYVDLGSSDGQQAGGIAPATPRFDGKVAVLTSATNSSATFQFAHRAQKNQLATLVGEPTGGNRRGINGGAYFFVRLPQSGLEFDLPLIGYFPETPQPDAGIVPDVAVSLTAADIAARRDRILERALAVVA